MTPRAAAAVWRMRVPLLMVLAGFALQGLPLRAAEVLRPQTVKDSMPTSADDILTKPNLDRVKRHILQGGKRCTYVNMYNHNPCLELAAFTLYLNPDPGPDGHPQWNIDCDPARGDFNTLVVHPKQGEGRASIVDFRHESRVVVRTSGGTRSSASIVAAKAVLAAAVTAALAHDVEG